MKRNIEIIFKTFFNDMFYSSLVLYHTRLYDYFCMIVLTMYVRVPIQTISIFLLWRLRVEVNKGLNLE